MTESKRILSKEEAAADLDQLIQTLAEQLSHGTLAVSTEINTIGDKEFTETRVNLRPGSQQLSDIIVITRSAEFDD